MIPLLVDKVNGMAGSNACRFCSQTARTKMNMSKIITQRFRYLLAGKISFRPDHDNCIISPETQITDLFPLHITVAMGYHQAAVVIPPYE